jgi:iron complex outermembrane receptor protein
MKWGSPLLAAGVALAVAAEGAPARDLADLSLEELGAIEITSVSRRAERLIDAPASIFVITGEDIRSAGATSLPEALRLAPNLQVAQVNSSQYAISARGFNNAIGNKLLVLVDGRTVYTPLFSSVFWETQDVVLEDIERIEVISGPGATLWGANAVNGVINVITRTAKDTAGALVSAVGGPRESNAAVRYGGQLGGDGHYRFYAKALNRDNTVLRNGSGVADAWSMGQLGFRMDWGGSANNFTLQGDAYSGETQRNALGTPKMAGSNVLARWNRREEDGSQFRLQAYFDHTERDDPIQYRDETDIFDIEFQHGFGLTARQRLLWGGGYRRAHDHSESHLLVALIPARRKLHWTNLFVQDEIALTDRVALTLGIKLEDNVYSGTEVLPNARLAWKPTPDQLLWGSISKAVRAPSRIDREFFLPGTAPFLIRGGPNFVSEVSRVVEAGYRAQPSSRVSYSVTAFYHLHDKLRGGEPAPGGGFFVSNSNEGNTRGLEGWGSVQVTKTWRLSGGFVQMQQGLRRSPGSLDPTGPSALGNDPERTRLLRSTLNLGARGEFDLTLRHVSALPNPLVPAYTAIDVRFGWRLQPGLDLSLIIRNLFDPKHVEFGAPAAQSEFGRAVLLKLVWRK